MRPSELNALSVGVLLYTGADSLDVVGPVRVFGAADDVRTAIGSPPISIHIIAETLEDVALSHGLVVKPSTTIDPCPELDVLVVPGGSSQSETTGRRSAQRNPQLIEFVRRHASCILASVCTGAFILAEAGLLDSKRANTHWRYREELSELMCVQRGVAFELVPERVTWDGSLVSGGGVTSGIDVALAIVGRLCGDRTRLAVERAIELETPAS